DSRELYSMDSSSIVAWDATAREQPAIGPDPLAGYLTAAISADATKVAFNVGQANPMFSIWDLAGNQEVFRLKKDAQMGFPAKPCFSLDGRRVAFVSNGSVNVPGERSKIEIFDTKTNESIGAITVESPEATNTVSISSVVFRADSNQLAALIRHRN